MAIVTFPDGSVVTLTPGSEGQDRPCEWAAGVPIAQRDGAVFGEIHHAVALFVANQWWTRRA